MDSWVPPPAHGNASAQRIKVRGQLQLMVSMVSTGQKQGDPQRTSVALAQMFYWATWPVPSELVTEGDQAFMRRLIGVTHNALYVQNRYQ